MNHASMTKILFMLRIIMLVLFITVFILVVKYAGVIRNIVTSEMHLSGKNVAGAKTSFEKEVKQNLGEYKKTAERQIVNIKVSDVLSFFGRVGKIGKDVLGAKDFMVKQTSGFLNNNKQSNKK